MMQRPSGGANKSSATQETLRILRNPKVRHRIYNSPPSVTNIGLFLFTLIYI
jgi:hypothetical protein